MFNLIKSEVTFVFPELRLLVLENFTASYILQIDHRDSAASHLQMQLSTAFKRGELRANTVGTKPVATRMT